MSNDATKRAQSVAAAMGAPRPQVATAASVATLDTPEYRRQARAELERAGFVLFPLLANTKKPAVSGWKDARGFTVKDSENVAIYTGAFRDGGALIALDVDTKHGKPGNATLRALEATHGPLPATREHATPSGGRHLFYRVRDAVRPSVEALGPGLDVRSDASYVAAPGSFIEGKPYTVAEPWPIADAPAWLVDLCGQRRERDPNASEPMPGIDPERAAARAVEYLQHDAPAAVQGDGGDETAFKVACRVRDFGVSESECMALMAEHWNERCSPPWSAGELADKVRNAYAYASNRQGADAPEAVFAGAPLPAPPEAVPAVARDETAAPRLHLVSIRSLEDATLDPPRFVVDRIIPASEVTLLGGHGGSGKSILALSIAAHVAAGAGAWAGLAINGGPALFVSLEDRGDFVRWRLKKVIGACGLHAANVEEGLRVIDGTAAGALMAETFRDGSARVAETPSMRELRALVRDAGLIVIDNASDAFDGNENARRQVRAFVRALKELGRANDAAVLLLAHIDKNAARFGGNGNSYSGSSAWHNSARSRLALVESDGKPLTLMHEKSNLGPKIAPLRLEWTPNGVLMPAGTVPGRQAHDDAQEVLQALAAAEAQGVSVPGARTGPNTAQRVLETFDELPQWLRGRAGRDAFWTAINALHAGSRVVLEAYKTPDRKQRTRLRTVGAVAPAVPTFGASA